jgi:hypothetical protein
VTIHLVSVGKSILDFLADPHRDALGIDEKLADCIAEATPTLLQEVHDTTPEQAAALLRRCLVEKDAELVDALAAMCARIKPGDWAARVSAELATFANAGEIGSGLPNSDVAVLLTSDTSEGMSAGLWNALALTRADIGRVRYLTDLTAASAAEIASLRGSAVIVRVRNLDARNAADFRAAMGYLGLLGKSLLDQVAGEAEPFRFYLSGGFKATIPYLIALAEWTHSLTRAPVSAWVLHETTDTAIELPLRRLRKDVIDTELKHFVHDVSDRRPEGGMLLEGYAYEQQEGTRGWELTPFGAGLRALYGMAGEATG